MNTGQPVAAVVDEASVFRSKPQALQELMDRGWIFQDRCWTPGMIQYVELGIDSHALVYGRVNISRCDRTILGSFSLGRG